MRHRLTGLALHHHTLTAVAALVAGVVARALHDSSAATQAEVQGLVLLVATPLIGSARRAHDRRKQLARYHKAANIVPLRRNRR